MIMADASGRIVLANAEAGRLFGYGPDELLQHEIEVLVPAGSRTAHERFRADFHADPKARPMGADRELHGVRKDGTVVPVEVGLSPIQTREGWFVIAAIVDITERKRMQEELSRTRSLAAIGEMAATVAHEVRNPLASISGPLQMLAKEMAADDPRRELIHEILGQVQRLDDAVSGLLAISREPAVQRRPVVFAEAVEYVGRLLAEHERARGVRVRFVGDPRATLNVDPASLEQVLWNLFLNAAEAMKSEKEIRVTLEQDGARSCVSIIDSGAGISPDILSRLFRPFVTTKPHGTGLGLSLCRKLVEAHGGTITVASELDKGTTIRLEFPL
jgi:PAS domain S-box-containing protein